MRKNLLAGMLGAILLTGCGMLSLRRVAPGMPMTGPFFQREFASNGERLFLTATNEKGEFIPYTGGPGSGGMMMGAYLTCAACHGVDGRGGGHTMHMQVMDAPDISYEALNRETGEHGDEDGNYNIEHFRQAVVAGKHPDGETLSRDMLRWQLDDDDLADLLDYLKTIRKSEPVDADQILTR